jgi:hypothetical protein
MSSVVAARLVAHRSPAARRKRLLLGPPLAASRPVAERLRKVVALAVFSSDAISSTALTVAVRVTGGVAALTPAVPPLPRLVIFAAPTYPFVGSCALTLLVGLVRLASGRLDALHVAADPGLADRLSRLWADLPLTVPLEVVHCPNRDPVECATDAVADRVRPRHPGHRPPALNLVVP